MSIYVSTRANATALHACGRLIELRDIRGAHSKFISTCGFSIMIQIEVLRKHSLHISGFFT